MRTAEQTRIIAEKAFDEILLQKKVEKEIEASIEEAAFNGKFSVTMNHSLTDVMSDQILYLLQCKGYKATYGGGKLKVSWKKGN